MSVMSTEDPLPTQRPFYTQYLLDSNASPWSGKTQAWVEDQGVWGFRSATQTTKEWVWEQQIKDAIKVEQARRARERETERKWWEATARSIDLQARRWMAQAEASRKASLLEAEKTRKLQEEVRRARERTEARGAEKQKAREEARVMSDGENRGPTRKERERATKKLLNAWTTYESRWAVLQSSPGETQLTFRSIPWPLINTPTSPSSISAANIAFFLLSPLHSGDKSRKERIREAMQRWHNDKFEPRILPRVVESERNAVKEGVDIVARCLNELLATTGPS